MAKLFRCCLCGYRARHRSNVVRHVRKIHSIEQDTHVDASAASVACERSTPFEVGIATTPTLADHDDDDEKQLMHDERSESRLNYSFHKTVQVPLTFDHRAKSHADIHLSINIYLPKRKRTDSVCSRSHPFSCLEDATCYLSARSTRQRRQSQ